MKLIEFSVCEYIPILPSLPAWELAAIKSICSFNKHLLSTYYIGPVLGSGNKGVNITLLRTETGNTKSRSVMKKNQRRAG